MVFTNDIFISYAQSDNDTLTGRDIGWITRLDRDLKVMVKRKLARDVKIWRDTRDLEGNSNLDEVIKVNIQQSKLLLTILSPLYINREWTIKELNHFCSQAQKDLGLSIDNKSRILKVVKSPIWDEKEPEPLKNQIGIPFFEINPEDDTEEEYDPDFGEVSRIKYTQKLRDLCMNIRDTLILFDRTLNNIQTVTSTEHKKPVKTLTVYLAVTNIVDPNRDKIEKELRARGYQVLPDSPLPANTTACIESIEDYLNRSDLAISIIGQDYDSMLTKKPTR